MKASPTVPVLALCGGRAVCGAHGCGVVNRLDGVEFDAVPHHAAPLPSSARHWLFGVESLFVTSAIALAALLLDRDASPGRQSPDEVVPLAYWPGKPRRPCGKDSVVVQTGAAHLTKATARMLCDPHVQLLAPLVFYTGASLGFLLNDFTVVSRSDFRQSSERRS